MKQKHVSNEQKAEPPPPPPPPVRLSERGATGKVTALYTASCLGKYYSEGSERNNQPRRSTGNTVKDLDMTGSSYYS